MINLETRVVEFENGFADLAEIAERSAQQQKFRELLHKANVELEKLMLLMQELQKQPIGARVISMRKPLSLQTRLIKAISQATRTMAIDARRLSEDTVGVSRTSRRQFAR